MLAQGEAVGHARDVVGHRAMPVGALREFRPHFLRPVEVGGKQLPHGFLGLAHAPGHLRVAVEVGKQKFLELCASRRRCCLLYTSDAADD